jgi:LysR family transcriptional regulator, low CO2-responsive transcriptional regulator
VIAQEPRLLREPGSGTRETTEEFWAAASIEPTSVMTVGSNGAIKQAASVGLGVTLLSLDAVAGEIDAGTLSLLPVAGTPLERPWHVLYVRDSPLPRSAQLFLELMRTQPLT